MRSELKGTPVLIDKLGNISAQPFLKRQCLRCLPTCNDVAKRNRNLIASFIVNLWPCYFLFRTKYKDKMVLLRQQYWGQQIFLFVAATKNFAAATKRFVDRTKHFVVLTKYFRCPYFNKRLLFRVLRLKVLRFVCK